MTFSFARMGAVALGISLMVPQAYAADKNATPDPVVATVNGTEIRESQLSDVFAALPPQVQQQVNSQGRSALRGLAEMAVNNKLVSDDARKEGLSNDPDLKKALKLAEDQLLRQAWIKKRGDVKVSDDQLKKRYDELVATFKPQEEVRAHHVLLETEDQAKAVIADLRSGGNFEDIAKAKSKDPSAAKNGGDLGFFAKGQMVPEFADAAYALKIGEVSAQPVKTQFGWHVIRVDEKRMSTAPAFADSKEDVRRQIAQQTIQDALKALRDKAKVDIKVSDAPAAAAPAPAPAGK